MRLICYLVLASCCSLLVKGVLSAVADDKRPQVTDYADKSSSERQFINSVKKWLLGSGGDEKKTKKPQIKYLPVYIPVPVYSDVKPPAGSDFYGAYQFNPGESPMIQVPNLATLPYAHSHKYDLPYTGQLHRESIPFDNHLHSDHHNKREAEADFLSHYFYQQVFRNQYPYYGYTFPHASSYAPAPVYYDDEDVTQEPEENDTVVIENPSLETDANVQNDADDYIRNGNKVVKKTRRGDKI